MEREEPAIRSQYGVPYSYGHPERAKAGKSSDVSFDAAHSARSGLFSCDEDAAQWVENELKKKGIELEKDQDHGNT